MKQHQLSCVIAGAALICCTHSKTFAQTDWHITGNSGTNATTNFIGTTDNVPLSFRINNTIRMRIGTTGNLGIGSLSPVQRLDVNGNINIGKGFSLFMENRRVLRIDSVNGNIFLGNGTGVFNNTQGIFNTITGYKAFANNTTGHYNTANGYNALYSNTTGTDNTATGLSALYGNNTGSYNTATGVNALANNTTGSENSAYGVTALFRNISGRHNTAMGYGALFNNSNGSYNTGIGYLALYNTVSNYNIAVGYQAGDNNSTGSGNVFLGAYSDVNWPAYYNVIAIGDGAICTDANQARIGNAATKSIGGYANWTNISDGRVKKNIKENVPGLAFINKLKPVTYNLNLDAADNIIQPPAKKDKDGKLIARSQLEINSRNAKEQIVYTGFIAQDVEKAAKELNYDFSGVDAAKNDKDLYGLRYAEFVVPLVKAVQELSQKVEKLEAALAQKNSSSLSPLSSKNVAVTDAALGQNTPDPFNRTTTISYILPQKFSHAQIVISDNSGNIIKQVNISSSGKGTINVDASTLSSGTYHYSLVVDGKLLSSKQMVLAK